MVYVRIFFQHGFDILRIKQAFENNEKDGKCNILKRAYFE